MKRPLSLCSFREFLHDDGGATAIEYALIASGVAGAIIAVVMSLGTAVQTKYQSVNDAMK
jgi:pilus assembly protein Flp/PilA